jgi:hypothetical protein
MHERTPSRITFVPGMCSSVNWVGMLAVASGRLEWRRAIEPRWRWGPWSRWIAVQVLMIGT